MFDLKNNFMKIYNISLCIISSLLLLVLSIYLLSYYKTGIDTIWDEGFYMMWLNDKNTEIQYSQSYNIINIILGVFKNKLIEFRLITLLLKYLFILVFLLLFKLVSKRINLKTTLLHFLILSLSFLPSFLTNSKVFCYREIQQFSFLISWIICISINFKSKTRLIQYFVLSFLFILTSINIPPSGIINSLFCISFIIFYYKPKVKEFLYFISISILSLLIINFSLTNILQNIKEIYKSGLIISNGESSHTIINLINMYAVYFKFFISKYLIVITLYISLSFISSKFFTLKLALTFITLIYSFFNFSFCVEILIIPIIIFLLSYRDIFKTYNNNILLLLFLLICPFTAVFGSAVPISLNLYYYLPIWIILIILIKNQLSPYLKQLFNLFIILFVIFSFYNVNEEYAKYLGNQNNSKERLNFKSKIDDIKITKNQKKYFNSINKILSKTNYNKETDYFFTLNYDLMTIYLFDGKLCTKPYHQLGVFLEDKKYYKPYKTPKYIILDQSAALVISKNNDWNFPKSYKKHFVGCPDIGKVVRTLYVKN